MSILSATRTFIALRKRKCVLAYVANTNYLEKFRRGYTNVNICANENSVDFSILFWPFFVKHKEYV